MKRESISKMVGNIQSKHIAEAANYSVSVKPAIRLDALMLRAPVAACLIICLLIGTAVTASYGAFEWSSKILFEDGTQVELAADVPLKDISENAIKTDRAKVISMTHAEIEQTLGVEILDYAEATSHTIGYQTHLNDDGTIGRVDLWWADLLQISEGKELTLSVSMLNTGADKGYVMAFEEGIDASGGKVLVNTITENALNTKMIVYRSGAHDNLLNISFVYDGILYQFGGFDFTEEEMMAVINQLQ